MMDQNINFVRFVLIVFLACSVLPSLLYKLLSSTLTTEEVKITRNDYHAFFSRNGSSGNNTSETEIVRSCIKPSIDNFPPDLMTQNQRQKGGVVVHSILAFYMVLAVAVACDDYLVPSLELIAEKLHMSSDVAGATFLAVGSSAPELFTSVIGAFVTKSDIGLGTITGSCTYNILFIVAVCSFLAGSSLRLSRWALFRDSLCYLLSITALVVVTYDRKVYWYEALVMVCLYLLYTAEMYFNQSLQNYFQSRFGVSNNERNPTNETASSEKEKLLQSKEVIAEPCSVTVQDSLEVKETDDNNATPFLFPKSTFLRALWIIALPTKCLFYLTIPDCRKERWENWYPVSFVVSLLWIGLFTYCLVWMVTIIGFTAGIPDVILGFTLLAAGCSAPESLASVIIARKGHGDMSVAQSLGSNTFDILFCLGLPWFLKTVLASEGGPVDIVDDSLLYSTLCLYGTVILFLLCLTLNKWHLNKFLGILLFCFYLSFVAVATLFGLNVFGDFNPSTCRD